jgi:hypothetical protein
MNTHPSDYGTIHRNTITNIICNKFGAKRKYKEKVDGIGSNDSYDNNKDITTKMLKNCLYAR